MVQLCLSIYVFNTLGTDFCMCCEVGIPIPLPAPPYGELIVPSSMIRKLTFSHWHIISPSSYVKWHHLYELIFGLLFLLYLFIFSILAPISNCLFMFLSYGIIECWKTVSMCYSYCKISRSQTLLPFNKLINWRHKLIYKMLLNHDPHLMILKLMIF